MVFYTVQASLLLAFSSNIDLNNFKIRISNNPCDRITKESLKPLATNKL